MSLVDQNALINHNYIFLSKICYKIHNKLARRCGSNKQLQISDVQRRLWVLKISILPPKFPEK